MPQSRFDALASKPHTIVLHTGKRLTNAAIVDGRIRSKPTPLVNRSSTWKAEPPAAANDNTPHPGERQPGEPCYQWGERIGRIGSTGANQSPLDHEFNANRINADLAIAAEWFHRQWHKAHRYFGTENPTKQDRELLIGAEINADAAIACRYVAYRMGHLYQTIVGAIINDEPMESLCGGESASRGERDRNRIGRQRVTDALKLLAVVYDAWIDLASGAAMPSTYALGPLTRHVPPARLSAANDNAKAVGRRTMLAA
jgi:hypothetical protein